MENPEVSLFDAILAASEGERLGSGVRLSERGAMGALAAATCVHVLSETFAGLPFHVMRVAPDGTKEPVPDNPFRVAIAGAPNDEMDGFVFGETLCAHLLTWGVCYAYIDYDLSGRALLWPIPPDRARIEVLETNQGTLDKVVLILIAGRWYALPPERMLVVTWLGFDGLRGYSPIRMAARNLGLSIAMEKFAERFFGAGAYVAGVVTHPKKLEPPTKARLRESLEHLHSGLERSHRFALLDDGMSFTQLQMPLEDLQLLESRSFARAEVAGLYRLTPDRVNVFEKSATYASLDAAEGRFVKDAIAPLALRFEAAINRQLLGTWSEDVARRNGGSILYGRFNLDGVLRGDPKVRAEVQEIRRRSGIQNANEIRAQEDWDPIPGAVGETYLWLENQRPADLPYPTSRGGTVAGAAAAPQQAQEGENASAQITPTAEPALRVVLAATWERVLRREGHALGRLLAANRDPSATPATLAAAWYQELSVESLAGELSVAFATYAAALGTDGGELVAAHALARAEVYRESRVRSARDGEHGSAAAELVHLEVEAAVQQLKPRLLALGRTQ
jgi:HK97 family phage portal protein